MGFHTHAASSSANYSAECFHSTNAEKTTSPPHRPVTVTAAHFPTVEAILEWPVFEGLDLRLHGRSLALMHEVRSDTAATGSPDEASNFLHLKPAALHEALDGFLHNVHSKNPVLDPQILAEARSHCVQAGGFDNKPNAALAVGVGLHSRTISQLTIFRQLPALWV